MRKTAHSAAFPSKLTHPVCIMRKEKPKMNRQAKLYTLDFRDILCYSEIHQTLKRSLELPDYYGENWDALWDCLTDMASEPLCVRVLGFETLKRRFPAAADTLLEIFCDLKAWSGDRQINIKITGLSR